MADQPQPTSIAEALQAGLEQIPAGAPSGTGDQPSGTDGNKDEGKKPEGDSSKDKAPLDGVDPNKDQAEKDKGAEDQGKSKDGKDPLVDPDTGTYKGEYNEKRFNGLMHGWQEDRKARLAAEDALAKLQGGNGQPPAKQDPKPADPAATDIPLPPELQNADEETKQGFKTVVKTVKDLLSKETGDMRQSILDEIANENARPHREQAEQNAKITREVKDLSTEFGPDFSDNFEAVKEYAIKHNYPLGSLRQAFSAWKEIDSIKRGRTDVSKHEDQKKKDAELAGTDKTRDSVIPKFDPERDGKKSIYELMSEGMGTAT